MKIAVFGQNYIKDTTQDAVEKLLNFLLKKDVSVVFENGFLKTQNQSIRNNPEVNSFYKLDASFDLLVSIGGDGTILRAITFVRDLGIPIVGINTGRLGFLATIQTDDIKNAMTAILNGDYKISERSLLTVTTEPKNEIISWSNGLRVRTIAP